MDHLQSLAFVRNRTAALSRALAALGVDLRGNPRVAWFGGGLVTAVATFLGYQLLGAPALAAQAAPLPPRPMPPPLRVQVSGDVASPGAYDVPPNARVEDALRLAGGPTEQADVSGLNLAAHLFDGQRVFVPRQRGPDDSSRNAGSRGPPEPGSTAEPWPTRNPPWPSATPWPTRTARPTTTEVPTKTPLPTLTPLPTRTARPTATEVPTRTPLPTLTPWPIRTPRPSATPWPTRTALQTRTPWPTRTPFPTRTPPAAADLQHEVTRDAMALAMLLNAVGKASGDIRAGPVATLKALAGEGPPR